MWKVSKSLRDVLTKHKKDSKGSVANPRSASRVSPPASKKSPSSSNFYT